jgi:transcriptional regulator with XRE-family HTH domain
MTADPRVSYELRVVRENLMVTGETVAKAIGWSPSKVSRVERGHHGVDVTDLNKLLTYYVSRGLPEDRAVAVTRLHEQARGRGIYGPLRELLGGAELASIVMQWSPLHVPKLLQVPGYVTAALASRQPVFQHSPAQCREITAAIGAWQQMLAADPPLRLRAVLDESVLYRKVGPPEVMRAQLHYLDRIGTEPGTDVKIRVLSLDGGGPAEVSPFAYLEYPPAEGVTAPGSVLVDDLEGLRIPDLSEQAVWRRQLTFQQLWEAADEPGPVIKRALHDAWPETG